MSLLLGDRVVALLDALDGHVARVDDVPRLILFGLAHVDDERAFVDEPDGVGGRHVGRALGAQPELVEQNSRPREHEACDEPNVVAGKFDELGHEFVVVAFAGQYNSAASAGRPEPLNTGRKATTLRPRMRIVEPSGRRRLARLGGVAVATVVLGWSLGIAQERRESEAALSAVRKEIKALQERLARETTRRDEGAQALRAAEVEIATATRTLAELRSNLKVAASRSPRPDAGDRAGESPPRGREVRPRAPSALELHDRASRSCSSCCCRRRARPLSGACSSTSITTTARAPRASMRSPASSRSLRGSSRKPLASKLSSRRSKRRKRARSRGSRPRATSAVRPWRSSTPRFATARRPSASCGPRSSGSRTS